MVLLELALGGGVRRITLFYLATLYNNMIDTHNLFPPQESVWSCCETVRRSGSLIVQFNVPTC